MTSATERLRALLDERGEYYQTSGNRTWWGRPIDARTGEPINVFHNQAQPMGEDRLLVELQLATPEQAIAATLGPEDAYTREDVESAFVSGYSLGSLPVGSDPQWNQNEQTVDEHMAELGWVRKDAATLGETPTPPPPTMPKQPPYDLLIDLLRDEWGIDASWDGLRRFWYVCLNEKGMRMRDEREVATLGPGTCRITDNGPWGYPYVCSECGASFDPDVNNGEFNYCPSCGRKVVD